jgi:putative oxidoreductase
MGAITQTVATLLGGFAKGLDSLSSIFQLLLRVYVANVFFKSGLTKIADFSSTIALFENEYKVPLLSPTLAAISGTATELALPVLLVLGIATRPTALALFIFNIVAVLSYPDISEVGVQDHKLWGLMLLVTLIHGPGRIALDHQIQRRFGKKM